MKNESSVYLSDFSEYKNLIKQRLIEIDEEIKRTKEKGFYLLHSGFESDMTMYHISCLEEEKSKLLNLTNNEIMSLCKRQGPADIENEREFTKKMQLWKKLHSARFEWQREEAFDNTKLDEIPFRTGSINDEIKRVGTPNQVWFFDEINEPKYGEEFTYIDINIIKNVAKFFKDKLNENSFGKIQRDLDKADEKAGWRNELVEFLEGLVLNLYFIQERRNQERNPEWDWQYFYNECYKLYCWVCLWIVLDAGNLKGKKLSGTDDGIIKELSFSKIWLDVAKRWSGISAENLESVAREWKFIKKSEGLRYPEGWTAEQKREYKKERGIERKERSDKGKEREKKIKKVSVSRNQRELIEKIVKFKRNRGIEEFEKLSQRELGEIFQTSQSNISKVLVIIDQYHITYRNYNSILV